MKIPDEFRRAYEAEQKRALLAEAKRQMRWVRMQCYTLYSEDIDDDDAGRYIDAVLPEMLKNA